MNIGVIGVGVMGSNHARVLYELGHLAAVSDIDNIKLSHIKEKFNARCYNDHKDMITKEKLDGVVVAVQPKDHMKIVIDCLNAGLNVLVEKPISHYIKEAEEIVALAESKGLKLMVGHIERYNPVVTKLKELIDNGKLGKIYIVNTVRIGPFPKRLLGSQDGVLIDISVHDIDIISYLVGNIAKVQSQLIYTDTQEIYAKCLYEIEGNVHGSSEFSWISPKKVRTIEIYGEKGCLRGNYQTQEVTYYENSDYSEIDIKRLFSEGKISEGNVTKEEIIKQEPLKVELDHFVNCISNNREPLTNGKQAIKTLNVALKIKKSGLSAKRVIF